MQRLKKWVAIGMILVLVTTGCAQKNDQSGSSNRVSEQNAGSNSLRQQTADGMQKTKDTTNVPLIQKAGKNYVEMRKMVDVLQFQSKWNPDTKPY